jgi:glutamate dehydrogenase (NADP+)
MSQNSLRLNWTSEEVDGKLKGIMLAIHASCVKYGSDTNGYVDYVKDKYLVCKVADAMLAQGWCKFF